MKKTQAPSIDLSKIIKTIKKADGNFVKVELEADFGRGNAGEDGGECLCEVDGTTIDFADNDECKQYILGKLSAVERRSIVYSKFYFDGSVDSEFTFTVATRHIKYIPKVIEAFWSIGGYTPEKSIVGAGIHIAVMTSGSYQDTNTSFDELRLELFKRKVTKLLPALYFLGSSTPLTRPLRFRMPRIYSSEKYSAIHVKHSFNGDVCALEYRIFDPCYHRPQAIFEYLHTVAKTLEYYIDPDKKTPMEKYSFSWFDDVGSNPSISRFFLSKNNLLVLDKLLPSLLPEGVTIEQAKKSRNFTLSNATIERITERKVAKLRNQINDLIRSGTNVNTIDIRISQTSPDWVQEN